MRCFCYQVLICSDLSEVAGNIRSISEHCMTSNRDRPSGACYPGTGLPKSQHVSDPNEVFLFIGIDVF